MKIDHGIDEDTSAVKTYIVGGYASHGWLISGEVLGLKARVVMVIVLAFCLISH